MKWAQRQSGFTIVELLIVVVVIAILAAITIVSYNGIQSRAKLSGAQSDLAASSKKIELYKVDKGIYPTSSEPTVWKELLTSATGDISSTTGKTFILCRNNAGDKYALAAWAPVSPTTGGPIYYVSSVTHSVSTKAWSGQGSFSTVAASVCNDLMDGVSHVWSHQL